MSKPPPPPPHKLAAALNARSGREAGFSWRVWVYAIGLLTLLGFASTFLVVFSAVMREEPAFVSAQTIYLPQRELEHRMNVTEFQQAASPPTMREKLFADTLHADRLPPLPALPSVDLALHHPINLQASSEALLGQAGLLGGIGGEAATDASAVTLLGIRDEATRVVIAFDVSHSVKTKVERTGSTMDALREETRRAIQGLNAHTLFGLIQFSRNYDLFRPYLLAATVDNKAAAEAWLDSAFRTDGRSGRGWQRGSPNGIQAVLRAAFALDPAPDLVILVSDGDFQRNRSDGGGEDVPWEEVAADLRDLQALLPEPARLSFVGFQMKSSDKHALNRLVRQYRGHMREVD